MAVPKGGFKITIDDGFEKMNKYYNTKVKGWTINRIDLALKQMFDSNKNNLQGEFDFLKASYILLETRAESLQKRLEEKENKLIESESLTELCKKLNSNLLSENERLDKLTQETLNKSIADKEEILKLLKENEHLKFEKSNYIECNLQLQKNLQTQKEISKSNSDSWDEMYQKLYVRKTIKQQFYSASNVLFLLAV